jgi:hypothetical protein
MIKWIGRKHDKTFDHIMLNHVCEGLLNAK